MQHFTDKLVISSHHRSDIVHRAYSGIRIGFFAIRRDLRRMRAMRTREIPFTEEVSDATMICGFGAKFNVAGYVTMVFVRFGTIFTNL